MDEETHIQFMNPPMPIALPEAWEMIEVLQKDRQTWVRSAEDRIAALEAEVERLNGRVREVLTANGEVALLWSDSQTEVKRLQEVLMDHGQCRSCGCSEFDACEDEDGEPCSWAEPGLCSACAAKEAS